MVRLGRSCIFYYDDDEETAIGEYMEALEMEYGVPLQTEVRKAETFWRAEEGQQR